MRVLTNVDDLGPLGGVEQHVFQMAKELARRHHHVDLLYRRAAGYEEEARAFCASVTRVPSFDAKLAHPLRDGRRIWPAIRAGARCHPEVVYANRFSQLNWAIPTAAASRAAVVCHLHFFQEHKITRLRSARVHRFVAVSRALAEQWERAGIDRERISVVPNGVDLSRFPVGGGPERRAARRTLQLPEQAFVVLYCGRMDTEKGVDVLVEAFRLLGRSEDQARLVLMGSAAPGTEAERYHEALMTRSPAGCHWLPASPDVVTAMHAADVVVVPSRSESFSRVVVEAMATGRPALASNVGGTPEILDGQFERFLVPPDDPLALARALEGLAGWREEQPGLAQACSAHVRDRFNVSRSVGLLELVFEEARSRQ